MTKTSYDITVMKFGGASVRNTAKIREAARVAVDYANVKNIIVVTSAVKGVTNELVRIAEDPHSSKDIINNIYTGHINIINEFNLNKDLKNQLLNHIDDQFHMLSKCIKQHKSCLPDPDYDFVISMGERIAAPILAAAICSHGKKARWIDSKDILITRPEHKNSKVLLGLSSPLIMNVFDEMILENTIPVMTGFYGKRVDNGHISTFGRGGSDYSATVIASAYAKNYNNIHKVILWKDETDGVYDKDPNLYPNARHILRMSYAQATKIASNGARVLHPYAIEPIENYNVELYITKPYADKGTKILMTL